MSIWKKCFKFIEETMAISFLAIFVMTIIAKLSEEDIGIDSSLFVSGGVSFSAILQVFLFACIIMVINRILDHPKILPRTRLLYKIILRMGLIVIAMIPFVYFGHWFPINHMSAWVSFFVCFGICFAGATIISLYMTKKKDKEYEELLQNYKRKRGKDI